MEDLAPPVAPASVPTTTHPRPYFVLIPIAFILGMLAGYLVWGTRPGTPSTAQAPSGGSDQGSERVAGGAEGVPQVIRYDVPVDDDPVFGPEDAPITIIEFSDYECPYCRMWHVEVFDRLMSSFPGQIRFVYRDFPITSSHPNAAPAAEAANCAYEQGKFWEFHDMLFTRGLGGEAYIKYAAELSLDMAQFEDCVSSRRYKDEVMADLEWAANLGVSSTPTFFINGIAVVGAQPFELFQEIIQKELAGEIP